MKVKVSQTTARLLVALVARAGEGRRRVVADLAFALNGSGAQIGEIKTGLNIVSLQISCPPQIRLLLSSYTNSYLSQGHQNTRTPTVN